MGQEMNWVEESKQSSFSPEQSASRWTAERGSYSALIVKQWWRYSFYWEVLQEGLVLSRGNADSWDDAARAVEYTLTKTDGGDLV